MSKGLVLMCDGYHGRYIPQLMAWRLHDDGWTVNPDDVTVCNAGPDDFCYWEAWTHILDKAVYISKNGNIWRLHHDGDLWAVCEELMSDEEKYNFFGEY